MSAASDYRKRVLRHWQGDGWRAPPFDVQRTKRGEDALGRLVADGMLKQMDGAPYYYRITDAGRAALSKGGSDA